MNNRTPPKCRKVIVLEPGMRILSGHHHMWNTLLQDAFKKENIPHEFIFHRSVPLSVQSLYEHHRPHFTYNYYADEIKTTLGRPLSFHLNFAQDIQAQLDGLTPDVDSQTLVFAHTLNLTSLFAIILWYAALAPDQKPVLILNCHFSHYLFCENDCTLLHLVGQSIVNDDRVFLSGTTDHIVDFISKATGREAFLLPMPFAFAAPASTKGRHLIFGFTGEARLERIELVPEVIRAYLTHGGRGSFIIQAVISRWEPQGTAKAHEIVALQARYPGRISVVTHGVYGAAYLNLLAQFSAVLLPFVPGTYHIHRPSQVLQEAIYFNTPAIVCKGGYMEHEGRKYDNGSVIAEEPTVESLCWAMFEFEAGMEERLEKAVIAGERYRQFNNIHSIMQIFGRFLRVPQSG